MIIAVEGNVHVGKTTYCNKFAQDNPSYTVVGECKFDPTLSAYDTQLNYLRQEQDKKNIYNNLDLIMDRSIISTFIYTTFTNTLSYEQKVDIVQRIKTLINQQDVILPQKIVFLVTDAQTVANRQMSLGKIKGTQTVLGSLDYYNYYNDFFFKHEPEFVCLDRQNKIYHIDAQKVINTIKEYKI